MRRLFAALGALILALVTAAPPAAEAAPAPWRWVRVVDPVQVAPHGYYSIREYCPSGYKAVTGGLRLAPGAPDVRRNAEFRFDDETGSSWFIAFENFSNTATTAYTVAECVWAADLPAASHRVASFPAGAGGFAYGTIFCPDGQVVLTGGADWNNVNTRHLYINGPGGNGTSWTAEGQNKTAGAVLTVEIYCVDPATVPGYSMVEYPQPTNSNWERTITCPLGTRVLNGGTSDGWANASYPNLHTWTVSATYGSPNPTFMRAWCVAAGTPTVAITASDGPDGWTTDQPYALFGLAGTDPAGFPNSFRCSIDGAPMALCPGPGGGVFGPLSSGPHTFSAVNQPADGRVSAPVTFHWTVDRVAPTVVAPRLPQASLDEPVVARWAATDDHSRVDHHEAQYWRGRANGTTVDWRAAPGWSDLASPTVRLPALAEGDTVCVSVRAVDIVGNTSAWSAPRCTTRPYDDRGLTASAGWTRTTGTPYWLGTLTRASALGETLTRDNQKLRQVGILASVCATCGDVQVRIAGTLVGTLSTERATSAHRVTLLLPAFVERQGQVLLTSATSGKVIRIDGLIAIRRPATPPPP